MSNQKQSENSVGLGTAIEELIKTKIMRSMGIFPDVATVERQKSIVLALDNLYRIDIDSQKLVLNHVEGTTQDS